MARRRGTPKLPAAVGLTDAELRADVVAVSEGTRAVAGTLTVVGDRVTIATDGMNTVAIAVSGVFVGANASFVGKLPGGAEAAVPCYAKRAFNTGLNPAQGAAPAVGSWVANVAGLSEFTLVLNAIASGTMDVDLTASASHIDTNMGQTFLADPSSGRLAIITSGGALRVDQQAGIAPWRITVAPTKDQQLFGDPSYVLAAPGDVLDYIVLEPLRVYVEVAGAYTGAELAFTLVRDNSGTPLAEPILGQRVDTGGLESASILVDNSKQTWAFAVGLADWEGSNNGSGLGPTYLRIAATAITSGTIGVNATSYASLDLLPSAGGGGGGGGGLPPGASTSALQTTGNTSLATIATKTTSIDTKTPAVGQATMAASGPVVIASDQSAVPVSGPLTDAQLRASAVAMSAATLPLPAGAATSVLQAAGNASLTSIDGKTPGLGQNVMAASLPVAIASNQSALDIVDRNARVLGSVNSNQSTAGSNAGAWWTRIGDGTNGPAAVKAASAAAAATDPALVVRSIQLPPAIGAANTLNSLPVNIAADQLAVGLSVSLDKVGTVAVDKNAGVAGAGTQRVILASDQSAIPVTPPTLTKGAQGATGFSVQRLNDAGRNTRIFMLDAITAAPVAEALATVVQWYGNAAVGGTTQPAVVPAGKTLRLTGWKIQYQSLATVGYAVVRIRFNTGGLVVIGSPLVASFEAGSGSGATTVAMTGGVTTETGAFPEGLELPAGGGIGFSFAGYGPTGTLTLEGGVRFEVHGYEY